MLTIFRNVTQKLDAELGRWARCMRRSLLGASLGHASISGGFTMKIRFAKAAAFGALLSGTLLLSPAFGVERRPPDIGGRFNLPDRIEPIAPDRGELVAPSPPPPLDEPAPRIYPLQCPNGYHARNRDGSCSDNCCY